MLSKYFFKKILVIEVFSIENVKKIFFFRFFSQIILSKKFWQINLFLQLNLVHIFVKENSCYHKLFMSPEKFLCSIYITDKFYILFYYHYRKIFYRKFKLSKFFLTKLHVIKVFSEENVTKKFSFEIFLSDYVIGKILKD